MLFAPRRFRVLQNRWIAESVFSLTLEPADDQALPSFRAGQFIMLHLLNDDGSTWAKAAYSYATAPSDCQTSIELGIKLSGGFTQRAARLVPGDVVAVQGPYGVFYLKNTPAAASPLVLLAAGIGITPLRSMIRDIVATGVGREMFLFYSEKTLASCAYFSEFESLAAAYSGFHFVPCLTREAPVSWRYERGRVSGSLIEKYVPSISQAHYCLCGPDEFMFSMKDFLVQRGVDPKIHIQKESF